MVCLLVLGAWPAHARDLTTAVGGTEIEETDRVAPRILLTTEMGEIEIELDSAHAPATVTNFLR
jgi:hypothetical protein